MGKSPAKWIKSVLFGKKTSRSNSSKGKDLSKATNNRGYSAGTEPAFSENSPVISDPVLVSSHNNRTVPGIGKGEDSNLRSEGALRNVSQDVENQNIVRSSASSYPEKLREEQAAVKAQAAFRGYLARRAFRALKGIIRLQALIRGHLVRRQAVSTLRATWLIVKFQAVLRGRNVRLSTAAMVVSGKFDHHKFGVAKSLDTWKEKVSSNAYVRNLLSSPIIVEALHFQYDERDPNSAFNWLERWTISGIWKPISQPKRAADAKPQARKASYAMETESGKLKRNARKSSAIAVETCQTNMTVEPEKTKRNPRKFSSSPADSVPDSQLTELEKVKRNLRKVTNSMAEASKISTSMAEPPKVPSPATANSDNQDIRSEKALQSVLEVSSPPETQEPPNSCLSENVDMDILAPDSKPDLETPIHSVAIEEKVDEPLIAPALEVIPLQNIDNEDIASTKKEEPRSNEEPLSTESLKTSKRRSSFSTKSEYPENGVQNTPVLPSYMAATESAKAKLRGQISPRLSSDSAEKNGFTRRHSLPSSNSKLNSHSPRTQRPTQGGVREGVKSDRSMLPSRDAHDRAIKVEWRR